MVNVYYLLTITSNLCINNNKTVHSTKFSMCTVELNKTQKRVSDNDEE